MTTQNYTEVKKPLYLWSLGWYDGPIDGVCLFNGEKHYFQLFDEVYEEYSSDSENDWLFEGEDLGPYLVRHYHIRKLDPIAISRLEARNNLFLKYVGNNSNYYYDDQGKPLIRERDVKPTELHRYFYEHPLRDEIGTYLVLEFGLTFPILDTFFHILYSDEVKAFALRDKLNMLRGEIVAWYKN